MTRLTRPVALVSFAAFVGAAVASCLDATQITIDVRTDLRCDQVRSLSITAGDPGRIEGAPPTTETRRCLPTGEIGTLVVTPERTKSSEVAFKLVMGVDVPTSECKPPLYKGCVVQRRQLSYVPRRPLTVPVYMLFRCIDVPCDESTTCAANGQCVSAKITSPESCTGAGCFPPGDPSGEPDASPPRPPEDGGIRTGDDAGDGGGRTDGGSADGGGDGGATDGGGGDGSTFYCPNFDDGGAGTCAFGPQFCCATGFEALCGPPCPPAYSNLYCTSSGQCPGAQICCGDVDMGTVTTATCAPTCPAPQKREICHAGSPPCRNAGACVYPHAELHFNDTLGVCDPLGDAGMGLPDGGGGRDDAGRDMDF